MNIHPRFRKFYKHCEKDCSPPCRHEESCVVFANCGPHMRCAFGDIGIEGIIPCPKCYCWTAEGMTISDINENIKALEKIVAEKKAQEGGEEI